MPTVLRIGPYRLFFYSSDGDEPLHIHVERDNYIAKIWLDPIRLQKSGGFTRNEITEIIKIVEKNKNKLTKKWNEFFSNRS